MQDAEVQAFREIHDDLVTAVRVHEPVKRDLSAHPLVLQWCSRQTRQQKHVVVAFNVRKPPWDVVMLQLETLDAHNGRHCPFVLRMQSPPAVFSLQSLRSDIEFCHALAREASDWVLFRLTVGDLGAEFASFRIVERNELNRQALRQSAEEMKQIQRAAKAAKLAQGLAAQKKGKREPQANGKAKAKVRDRWLRQVHKTFPTQSGAPPPALFHKRRTRSRPQAMERPAPPLQGLQAAHPPTLEQAACPPDMLEANGKSRLELSRGVRSNWLQLFQRLVIAAGAPYVANTVIEEIHSLAKRLSAEAPLAILSAFYA